MRALVLMLLLVGCAPTTPTGPPEGPAEGRVTCWVGAETVVVVEADAWDIWAGSGSPAIRFIDADGHRNVVIGNCAVTEFTS